MVVLDLLLPPPLYPHNGLAFSVQLAVIIFPFNGIVAGIGLSHDIVYPSLVHDGYVIFDVSDLYAHVYTTFSFSQLQSTNLIANFLADAVAV